MAAVRRPSSLTVPRTFLALPLALLAACGGGSGGGGGGVQPLPAPPRETPPTVTTPTTTALPGDFLSSEYNRSNGTAAAKANVAYAKGATGNGVTAAIIDTGINNQSTEFSGRILAASRDVAGSRSIMDEDGHGTAVASILGAARDNNGTMGIAFDASLLILRTDTPGSCASATGDENSCKFNPSSLAAGIDAAIAARAKVINLSLGGGGASPQIRAALARAAAAGIVTVIAAGNEEESNPSTFAQMVMDGTIRGTAIIAGSVDSDGQISSFSNRAGFAADIYLTAMGNAVLAPDNEGTMYRWTGTSMAAPLVSGAVALLAQAFPNLTGHQLVDLLLSTARDAGTAGTDEVFGRGILDLSRAFAPQGTITLAGSSTPLSLGANGALSPAMGDAGIAAALGEAVILDRYDRAYQVALGQTIHAASRSRPLLRAVQGAVVNTGLAIGDAAMSVTMAPGRDAAFPLDRLRFGTTSMTAERDRTRPLAGLAEARLGRDTAIAIGYARDGASLGRRLAGTGAPFQIAPAADATLGFEARHDLALALRQHLGGFALTVSAEKGSVANAGLDPFAAREPAYRLTHATLQRRFGPLGVTAGAGLLDEPASVLGARFGAAIAGSARSWLADIALSLDPAPGWRIDAALRQGWTRADTHGQITGGRIVSRALAVEAQRSGLLVAGDRLGLRASRPLRVVSGGFILNLPTAYDYASGAVTYSRRQLDLSPRGRETMLEAAYDLPLGHGALGFGLFRRTQPDNIATAPADTGGILRFSHGF